MSVNSIGSLGNGNPKKVISENADTAKLSQKDVFTQYKEKHLKDFDSYKERINNDFDKYKKEIMSGQADSDKMYEPQQNKQIVIDHPPVYYTPDKQANEEYSIEMRKPENWEETELKPPLEAEPVNTKSVAEQNGSEAVDDGYDIKPFTRKQITEIKSNDLYKRAVLAPVYDLDDGSIEIAGVRGFVEKVVRNQVDRKGQLMKNNHIIYLDLIKKEENGVSLTENEKQFMLDFEKTVAQFYYDTEPAQ